MVSRLEAFARIVTTGFILDPEVPTSALFTAPFANVNYPLTYTQQSTGSYGNLGGGGVDSVGINGVGIGVGGIGTKLTRTGSQRTTTKGLSHTLKQMWRNALRPFVLVQTGS